MKVKNLPADVTVGAVVFVFAVFVLVASLSIPEAQSSIDVIGPKALPLTLSVGMAAASLALLVNGLRGRARAAQPAGTRASSAGGASAGTADDDGGPQDAEAGDDEGDDEEAPKPGRARRFLLLAAMLLAYILVFVPVGYLLSTLVFLFAVSTYIDSRKWIRNLVFSVFFSVVVYFAFTRGLQVGLPPGILG